MNEFGNLTSQASEITANLVNDFRNGGNLDQATKGAGSEWNARYFSLYGDTYSTLLNNYLQNQAWDMNNQYNTPVNQMKRLLDAGLNPNLAYNMATSGNSSSAPNLSSKISGTAATNAGISAKQAQTQRIAQIFGAISESITLFQQIMGMYEQGQKIQFNQNQLDFDTMVKESFTEGKHFGGDLSAGDSPTLSQLAYFSRYNPRYFSTINSLLSGSSLRDLQSAQRRTIDYQRNTLLPWQEKLNRQEWELRDLEFQTNKYQYELLNFLPPELRTIYNLLIAPFFGRLSFNFSNKKPSQITKNQYFY